MIFQCLRRACLIHFPAKWGLYLVLKTRGIDVDFGFSLMKCWRSSKLIKESALESSVLLYPLAESFSIKNLSSRQMCRDCCCFLHSGWSHLGGNRRIRVGQRWPNVGPTNFAIWEHRSMRRRLSWLRTWMREQRTKTNNYSDAHCWIFCLFKYGEGIFFFFTSSP